MSEETPTYAARLAAAIAASQGPVLAVTGAGVSAASGIRTYRGKEPDAVWRQHDVSMATVATWQRDPVDQLAWYLERFAAVDTAKPNQGHFALAKIERHCLERGPGFQLVTQNIDTLHEQAGSRKMIKVHGTGDRLRCGRPGCVLGAPTGSLARAGIEVDAFRDAPGPETLPRCPECDTPLRVHVLFFDEYYSDHDDYRYAEVETVAVEAGMMLFVGTSFAVGVTSLLLQAGAARQIPMFSIDPGGPRLPPGLPVEVMTAPAEDLLPEVEELLRR